MEKKEELKERVVMWRQWVITFVCLGLTCFHSVCIAYAFGVIYLKYDEPKTPGFPFKEMLVMAVFALSLLLFCIGSDSTLTHILEDKAAKHNFKPAFNPGPHISFEKYESQFFGTDLHKEAAWEFTKFTFNLCAAVYAFAFYLQVFSNVFGDLGPFSYALIIFFSAIVVPYCRTSFRVNMNIALCLGEDEQVIV